LFDIEDLRLLLALDQAKSLAGAARQIKVNHASAWRRLGNIEERLGARLFERGRDAYLPTSAGEEAIAAADRILRELEDVSRKLTGKDVRPTGTVRLTTTESLLHFVVPAIRELRQSHPGIVVEATAANAFFTLTRRDADVALRFAEAPPEGLVARRLASVAYAVYGAPAYLADKRQVPPVELDWIGFDDSLAHLRSARWLAKQIDRERVVHRGNSLLGLREAARAGICVVPLPCFLGEGDAGLVRVMPVIAEISVGLWLLTHPDLRQMPRVRATLDAIADYVSCRRAMLECDSPSQEGNPGR
jgi:DNA-binding transcriptional LysR family regulator